MKRSILRALALFLTTVFAASHAGAQAQDDYDKPGSSKSQGAPVTYGNQGTSLSSSSSQAGQPLRASKLMNCSLKSQTGDILGQVHDLVVDPTSGQIQFVVLSLSSSAVGALGSSSATTAGSGTRSTENSVSSPRSAPSSVGSYGTVMGGKLVAVPWRLLSQASGDQFAATVDRSKLESAPSFSSRSWPTMDSAWMQRVYSHFGVDATGTGAPGSSSGTGTGTGTSIGNPVTPGLPVTPGTPDISPPPATSPSSTPGTLPGTAPGAVPGASGPGTGTGGNK